MSKKLLFVAIFSCLALVSVASAFYIKVYSLADGQSAQIFANALNDKNVSLLKFEEKNTTGTTTCYIVYSDRAVGNSSVRDGLAMSCVK